MNEAVYQAVRRGRVRVVFEGDSRFLRRSMPHVVRDGTSRIVGRGRGDHVYNLDPGLYVIEAITLNGERSSKAIQVVSGKNPVVSFGYHLERSPEYTGAPRPVRSQEALALPMLRAQDLAEAPTQPLPSLATREPHQVELLETVNCGVVEQARERYVFAPTGELEQTPVARFAVGPDLVEVSLPLHNQPGNLRPEERYPLNAASVTVEETRSHGVRLVARFAPERDLASAMDRMQGTGAMLDATDLFNGAAELLYAKYSDPPAAALGALTMHRLGRLAEREGWVERLAGSFPWLPDGRILLAALLRDEDPGRRAGGLRLLLEASHQRPMFTDGLSLMVDLLRRWPDDASEGERMARVGALATLSVSADLGSTCLTTTLTSDLLGS